jgi:hypothetical protein
MEKTFDDCLENLDKVLERHEENHYWYFLTSTEVNTQANRITVVAFTRKYSGCRISTGNRGISSS